MLKSLILLILLSSNLFAKEEKITEVNIDASNLIIDQNNKTAIFTGNVAATGSDISIKADKMVAHYQSQINKFYMIELFDNITIIKADQVLKGGYGVYKIKDNIIELEGNVILTKADNILKSSYLIYNLNNGQIQIFNKNNKQDRIKAIFNPNNNLN